MGKDVYDIGALPPIGEVPPQMHAMLVRPESYGEPRDAIRDEVIDVPELGPRDVLVATMAAGVNFNNVWAARGIPVDVTRTQARWNEPTDFHIVGSDASGIVYAVGADVRNVQVGDHVTVHPGQWDPDDPWVLAGKDPGLAGTFRVWGYDTCWGSMAQFTKVQDHQCMPKAEHLTWEEAAAPTLTGGTAYRMLFGWPPNTVQPGDPVLVWGGAGGLGSLAVQLVTNAGGRAVAVVSSDEKGEYAKQLGAVGYVNRKGFDHWGVPPAWDSPDWKGWLDGAKAFGKAFWDALGEKVNPRIVFDHPGQDTIPTSNFVCDRGGMIVICAGTTGLRHGDRRALPLVPPEALPGLPPDERRAGARLQRARARAQDGHDTRPHVHVRRDPRGAPTHGRRDAPRGQRELSRRRGRARHGRGVTRQRSRSTTPSGYSGATRPSRRSSTATMRAISMSSSFSTIRAPSSAASASGSIHPSYTKSISW